MTRASTIDQALNKFLDGQHGYRFTRNNPNVYSPECHHSKRRYIRFVILFERDAHIAWGLMHRAKMVRFSCSTPRSRKSMVHVNRTHFRAWAWVCSDKWICIWPHISVGIFGSLTPTTTDVKAEIHTRSQNARLNQFEPRATVKINKINLQIPNLIYSAVFEYRNS